MSNSHRLFDTLELKLNKKTKASAGYFRKALTVILCYTKNKSSKII